MGSVDGVPGPNLRLVTGGPGAVPGASSERAQQLEQRISDRLAARLADIRRRMAPAEPEPPAGGELDIRA